MSENKTCSGCAGCVGDNGVLHEEFMKAFVKAFETTTYGRGCIEAPAPNDDGDALDVRVSNKALTRVLDFVRDQLDEARDEREETRRSWATEREKYVNLLMPIAPLLIEKLTAIFSPVPYVPTEEDMTSGPPSPYPPPANGGCPSGCAGKGCGGPTMSKKKPAGARKGKARKPSSSTKP